MVKKVVFTLLIFWLLALVACQNDNTQTVVTRLVSDTTEVVVTSVVNQETIITRVVEIVVTPTPTPLPDGSEIVTASLADIHTLNPILSNDGASTTAISQMFLSLLTLDANSGAIMPLVAQDWSVSDDGLTYRFTLRPDAVWSDGTPLTANDAAFTFAAITTAELNSPYRANFTNVVNWQVVDETTLEVQLATPDCTSIYAFTVGLLPAHVYNNDPANIPNSSEALAPSVVSGPFAFAVYEPGQFVQLTANANYFLGKPLAAAWQMKIYPSAIPMINDLLAGLIDYTTVDAEFVSRVESAMARGADVQIDKWFVNGFTYLAFNLADPANPQNGWLDENEDGLFTPGEPVQPQTPHPILGDVAVRQAIALALNYEDVVAQAVYGQGGRVAADISPAINWAYNDTLIPYETNLAQASELLDSAGWLLVEPDDPEERAIRIKNEVPLALTITMNADNQGRERIAQLVKQELEALGFTITIESLPFDEAITKLQGQTFDMAITGWLDVNPEPDDSGFLSYQQDTPGVGFNFASYYNEVVEENLTRGRTVPGCAAADRASFYQDNQAILYQEVPYVPLYAPLVNVVWSTHLVNFQPNAWNLHYNVQEWYITE